ncbi:MAG TPA: MCE family protein [Halieaceae bacterium]|nr:MCE family protein [Halieaceae bacterium]
MESKINYTIVGLFVVLLTAGLLGFAYWLASEGGRENYTNYHVYMQESVAGLSADAAVKYRGVDVGTVKRMMLDPKNPEQVLLVLRIKQETPITTGTRATIRYYGVTGLGYVELEGDDRQAPRLTAEKGKVPVILSKPSTMARLDEGLSGLAARAVEMLEQINKLLSDENQQVFSDLLLETKKLATQLRQQTVQLHVLIEKGVLMEDVIIRAFENVETSADSVEKMADDLRTTYASLGQQLQDQMQDSFAALNQLLDELAVLSRDMQRSVREFNAAPADLLFKRSSPRPGPGELP